MDKEIQVRFELEGWSLFFAELRCSGEAADELAALRTQTVEKARLRRFVGSWRLRQVLVPQIPTEGRSVRRGIGWRCRGWC